MKNEMVKFDALTVMRGVKFTDRLVEQPKYIRIETVRFSKRLVTPTYIVSDVTEFWKTLLDRPEIIRIDCLTALYVYYFARLIEEVSELGISGNEFLKYFESLIICGKETRLIAEGGKKIFDFGVVDVASRYRLSVDYDKDGRIAKVEAFGEHKEDDSLSVWANTSGLETNGNGDGQNSVILDFPKNWCGADEVKLYAHGYDDRFTNLSTVMMDLDQRLWNVHQLSKVDYSKIGGVRVGVNHVDVPDLARAIIDRI